LFGALGSLLIVWAAALLTFLLSLDKAYLHTFYSIETGPQFTAGLFHHHLGNDRLRIDIFTYNERLFSSDLHADILSWAHASFASWTSESATWFTPAVQATLPLWAIPSLLNGVVPVSEKLPSRKTPEGRPDRPQGDPQRCKKGMFAC
jgi:hypothetical protein